MTADSLLKLPAREIIGNRALYVSPATKRKRRGLVISVSGLGMRIVSATNQPEFVTFNEIIKLERAA